MNCYGCKKSTKVQIKRGEICLGLQDSPSPKHDIFRICFLEKGTPIFSFQLSPVELAGLKHLLDEFYREAGDLILTLLETNELDS